MLFRSYQLKMNGNQVFDLDSPTPLSVPAQALGSVYRDEIKAGDAARDKKRPQQDMFPEVTDE